MPHAILKLVNWPLDDALAEAIEPGRVMHLRITVRFEDIVIHRDGCETWLTSVLEIGQPYD